MRQLWHHGRVGRRRLIEIELSPGSRAVRRVLFWAIAVCGAIATITYLIPSHKLQYEYESHSDFSDSGYIPLLGLAGVTVLVAWLSRRRFGAGMIAAVVGAIAAFLEAARTIFTHLFSSPISHAPEIVHLIVLVAMFGASVVLLVLEPVLYLVERSSQERAERAFPSARVINT